jgi:hypothetical protein
VIGGDLEAATKLLGYVFTGYRIREQDVPEQGHRPAFTGQVECGAALDPQFDENVWITGPL